MTRRVSCVLLCPNASVSQMSRLSVSCASLDRRETTLKNALEKLPPNIILAQMTPKGPEICTNSHFDEVYLCYLCDHSLWKPSKSRVGGIICVFYLCLFARRRLGAQGFVLSVDSFCRKRDLTLSIFVARKISLKLLWDLLGSTCERRGCKSCP